MGPKNSSSLKAVAAPKVPVDFMKMLRAESEIIAEAGGNFGIKIVVPLF